MAAQLTLDKFFNHDLPNVCFNSSDNALYRIYLSDRRFATTYTPMAERNTHPAWWNDAPGLKSYIDMNSICEYLFTRNPDVLTPFLATLVSTFNIREVDHMKVAQDFYDCIKAMEADSADLELSLRDEYAEIH